MEKIIQVGIPCSNNCEDYVSFLLSSIVKTVNKERLGVFEIVLAIDDKVDIRKIDKIIKNNSKLGLDIVKLINNKKMSYPEGHCINLDILYKNFTSKYCIFADCDIAFLKKDWDKILIEAIEKDKKIIAIGSEYSRGKYQNFPNVIFSFCKTKELKSLNIDFAKKIKKIKASKKDCVYFGVEEGEEIFLDTAWDFCYQSKKSGYKGKVLKIVSPRLENTKNQMKFMESGMNGEEFQFENTPILTHVGRSSSRSFNSDVVKKWSNRVNTWIDKELIHLQENRV